MFKQLKPGDRVPADDYNNIGKKAFDLGSANFDAKARPPLYGVSASDVAPYSILGVYEYVPSEVNNEAPVCAVAPFGAGSKGSPHLLVTNGDFTMETDKPCAVEPVLNGRPMKLRVTGTGFEAGYPCGVMYGGLSVKNGLPGFTALTEKWTENSVDYIWAVAVAPINLYGVYKTTGTKVQVTGLNPFGTTSGTLEITDIALIGTVNDDDSVVCVPIIGLGWLVFNPGGYSFDVYWTSPNLYKVVNGGAPEVVLTGVECA